MPRRDRTGPWGLGSRSGRGLGPCGSGRVSARTRYAGRGLGYRGRFCARPGFWGPLEESEDRDWLREKRDFLREELAALEEYLED